MEEAERTIRQLRVDARAMQEDAEGAVAELARATRSLRDALIDLGRTGVDVRVELAGKNVVGPVVHVGDDVVRLVRVDRRVVDIVISAIGGVHATPVLAGHATVSTGYPATMLARCRELVQAGAGVELGRRRHDPVVGELAAATSTHVELVTSRSGVALVPLAEVAWVERLER